MRQVFRGLLPSDATAFLQESQSRDADWSGARSHPRFKPVVRELERMCGLHQRCMYCVDSAGTDVEHFKPQGKDFYPESKFDWLNLLLACSKCNSTYKRTKFPLDSAGKPLLIDPSFENPWDFLTYEPNSGYIKAAYDLKLDAESPKGLQTVEVLGLDCREVLQTGYRKTYHRLIEAMRLVADMSPQAFVDKLLQADDHGLLGWCFSPRGKRHQPFDRLTDSHLQIWKQLSA